MPTSWTIHGVLEIYPERSLSRPGVCAFAVPIIVTTCCTAVSMLFPRAFSVVCTKAVDFATLRPAPGFVSDRPANTRQFDGAQNANADRVSIERSSGFDRNFTNRLFRDTRPVYTGVFFPEHKRVIISGFYKATRARIVNRSRNFVASEVLARLQAHSGQFTRAFGIPARGRRRSVAVRHGVLDTTCDLNRDAIPSSSLTHKPPPVCVCIRAREI